LSFIVIIFILIFVIHISILINLSRNRPLSSQFLLPRVELHASGGFTRQ